MKKFLAGLVVVLLVVIASTGAVQAAPHEAQVGLYTASGSWDTGVEAIQNFLDEYGYTHCEINAWDVRRRDLTEYVDIIWFPGGWAWNYNKFVKDHENILAFVSEGHGYIGTCAGAFYACDWIIWEGDEIEYDLNLYDGWGIGSINEIVGWEEEPNWAFTTIALDSNHEINAGFPSTLEMIYYGGPYFEPNPGQAQSVVQTYDDMQNPEDATVTYTYGINNGPVLLMGPHPELGYNWGTETWNITGGDGAQWDYLDACLNWVLSRTNQLY